MTFRTCSLFLSLAALLAATGCQQAASCPAGLADCDGICVDTSSDGVNCGACGNVCASNTYCTSGACQTRCQAGTLACGQSCIDPQTDATHCGASGDCAGTSAGTACATGQACVSGACALVCQAGQVACGGACIDPLTDAAHCGASGDCAGTNAGTACTAGRACTSGACTLSCQPGLLDLDAPFATDLPSWITLVTGQQAPTGLWASTAAPLPTNTWWQNLVLGAGGNRVDFLPYQIKAEPVWLDVANAAPVTSSTEVTVPDRKQIMLGALQFDGSTSHVVQSHDLFSVTLQYRVAAGTMTLPLVQGMPYVTADYAGLRPMLLPGTYSFTSVNGSTSPGAVTGSPTAPIELRLSDGTTWMLYASAPVTFDWNAGSMTARATFSGTLRVANAPTPAAAAVLDAHAGAIPRGGTMEVSIACGDAARADVATVRFVYSATGSGPLLMMAMPHHMARMVAPTTAGLAFDTIRGTLQAVEGSTWTSSLPLTAIGWTAPRALAPAHLDAVHAALAVDAGFTPVFDTVDRDPYFGGKQLAKLARLALIADELGDTSAAASLRDRLRPLVAAWLDGENGNPLVYDTTWGGVVTTAALANPWAEFGQGHYNDHHFHYGYHLYAAAALARADPGFAASHQAGLLALVRDIANPSAADRKFPRFRHMDFFRGHSWAAGLTEFADGQNQESTSEAVNAWYAIHLLGLATGDRRMSDLGRVLLALEMDAARIYWQIPAASAVYQDPFAQNRCVGRLFETRATFDTWFGARPEYVYGIQMLPFTPISEELLSPTWIGDAWPVMGPAAANATQEWRGFLSMAHATVAREASWTEVSSLTAWDDGNSRTNALWWVASRP